MSKNEFNQREIDEGRLTIDMITSMVENWQQSHELIVDGKCGSQTQESISSNGLFVVPDSIFESTTLAHRALSIAISEIGNGEMAYGNNTGPHVNRYRSNDGTGKGPGGTGAWCAAFASYCFITAAGQLREPMPFRTSRSAKGLLRNAAKAGFEPNLDLDHPAPGDLIAWHRNRRNGTVTWQGHVGIVKAYLPDTGDLYVVEGNKNQKGTRVANVKTFIYPDDSWKKNLYKIVRV